MNTSLGYVVTRGSIGGVYDEGAVFAADAYPQDRITMWLAKGVIRAATQEDVDRFEGRPTGLQALGSTAVVAPTPLEQARLDAAGRRAEIEALEVRLAKLREADAELTKREQEQAQAQEAALAELTAAPATPAASAAPATPAASAAPKDDAKK